MIRKNFFVEEGYIVLEYSYIRKHNIETNGEDGENSTGSDEITYI